MKVILTKYPKCINININVLATVAATIAVFSGILASYASWETGLYSHLPSSKPLQPPQASTLLATMPDHHHQV